MGESKLNTILGTLFRNKASRSIYSSNSVPLIFLGVCILTYGLLLPRLGYYWDDWPWIWMSHTYGAEGMLKIDHIHRPLSGVILWVGALLSGESPIRWQILNLTYRWLSAVGVWWALLKLWPRQAERAVWVGLLFLVYPGFRQQFVSINSSRHILPLALFFFSLGFMVWAVSDRKRQTRFMCISLMLELVALLSTEYYYGLELVRPVVLWFALADYKDQRNRLVATLKTYAPYFLLLAVVVVWRFDVTRKGNYPVTLVDKLLAQPVGASLEALQTVFGDILTATLLAWSQIFQFPIRAEVGLRYVLLYSGLVLGATTLIFIYLTRLRASESEWKQETLLGAWALLVSGLPFLATGLQVGLVFPEDRAILPMIFGASLLFIGLLDGLSRNKTLKVSIISLTVGMAIGSHFLTATSYQRDWNTQRDFLSQLTWRIPGLTPGTSIVYTYTQALQDLRITDVSLTAPLNWIYARSDPSEALTYKIYDLRLREGSEIPALKKGLPIEGVYGELAYHSSTDNLLAVSFDPPGCLRVLHPQYDKYDTRLPYLTSRALRLTKLNNIQLDPASPARLPESIFGTGSQQGWCYYFQLADLARQRGDWAKIVEIGETAFNQNLFSPHDPAEQVPFIQGYAHNGQWERAYELTEGSFKSVPSTAPFLCAIWRDLADSTQETVDKNGALERVRTRLGCKVSEDIKHP